MSAEGRQWALSVKGLGKHYAPKVVLYYLGECHSDKRDDDIAWPSVKNIAEKVDMPETTVKHALKVLENCGLITTLNKGNQYRRTRYHLHLDITNVKVKVQRTESEGTKNTPSPEVKVQRTEVKVQRTESEGTKNTSPIRKEPSIEPSEEPSYNNGPRWLEILKRDSRLGDVDETFINTVETSYADIDLSVEALKCYEWLQSNAKGKKRKNIRQTWLNWLKNAKTDNSRAPPSHSPNGRQPWDFDNSVEKHKRMEREYGQAD